MIDRKELRELEGIAKKVVSKATWKKIKSIDDYEERMRAIKYATSFGLEIRLDEIDKTIKKMKSEKKDAFFVETKAGFLRGKVRLFEATFHKKDFNNVLISLKDVERELNV